MMRSATPAMMLHQVVQAVVRRGIPVFDPHPVGSVADLAPRSRNHATS